MPNRYKRVLVNLTDAHHGYLKSIAAAHNLSVSEVLRQLIDDAIEHLPMAIPEYNLPEGVSEVSDSV